MQYQGPKSFERLVKESYERIKTFFSRDDCPGIIVGGIGKIYNNGQKTITEGDVETNSKIDQKFEAMFKAKQGGEEGVDKAYLELMASCKDANILRPTIFGEYNHSLDLVVIAPDRIVKYIMVSKVDPREIMAAGNEELITNYLLDLNFPHRFTHEIVHWDFGGTKFNCDLQKYFYALGFAFDKIKDGKFSFNTAVSKASEYTKDAKEASKQGLEANQRLSNHFSKMIELGIFDLEEMATEIAAALIIPPASRIVSISGKRDIAKKLVNKAQSKGPADFIRYLKSKEDEAYLENRNVFELC